MMTSADVSIGADAWTPRVSCSEGEKKEGAVCGLACSRARAEEENGPSPIEREREARAGFLIFFF